MGTNLNFENFVNDTPINDNGNVIENNPLTRQTSSIYSLTFDEFQSTVGGSLGKDFGSMNMDELLKNIWSVEETQAMASSTIAGSGGSFGGGAIFGVENVQEGGGGGIGGSGGGLQRQGSSMALPRTLSLKTVDEVWRNMSTTTTNNAQGDGGLNMVDRQQTLGEITLEEFLARAGVVRCDDKVVNTGYFEDVSRSVYNTTSTEIEFRDSNQISFQTPNLPLNVNGVRSGQQKQQPTIYSASIALESGTHFATTETKCGVYGGGGGGGMGVVGLVGGGHVAVGSHANQLAANRVAKSNNRDQYLSSLSPVPYGFNGLRSRKYSGLEKVVERRQKRMIKNRESAARSRARKQAYTTELEEEVAKLKEENQKLAKKQSKIMEVEKNQVLEMPNIQRGAKRGCLRRMLTGPW